MAANHVISEKEVQEEQQYEQMNLLQILELQRRKMEEKNEEAWNGKRRCRRRMLDIKKKIWEECNT